MTMGLLSLVLYIYVGFGGHFTTGGSTPLLTYNTICDSTSGFCYQAFSDSRTHVDAWYECHNRNMHLAMPKTQAEIDFITTNITGGSNHDSFWIGMTDTAQEGSWTWLDTEVANESLIPWKTSEPKDSRGHDEDCVEIKYNGWNNAQCSSEKPYLCQTYSNVCSAKSNYVFGNNCYRIITGSYNWSTSLCDDIGGTLAMPNTSEINAYLSNINYEDKDMWIGLEGNTQDMWFRWIDGSVLGSYNNFLEVPVVVEGVFMTTGGFWQTAPWYELFALSYACEIPLTVDCGSSLSTGATISGLTTLGANSTYACADGYVPDHVYTVCNSNGLWHPIPTCLIDCGNYSVPNGNVISGNTKDGSTQPITCDMGYSSYYTFTTCYPEGYWYPTPVCIFDGCGALNVTNGNSIAETTTMETNVSFSCNFGYTHENGNWTVCSNNGTWSPVPACVVDTTQVCVCIEVTSTNLTMGELVQFYIQNLTLDERSLSSSRRQLTSAEDNRTSAKCIGISGVFILTVLWSLIVIPDMIKVLQYVADICHSRLEGRTTNC